MREKIVFDIDVFVTRPTTVLRDAHADDRCR